MQKGQLQPAELGEAEGEGVELPAGSRAESTPGGLEVCCKARKPAARPESLSRKAGDTKRGDEDGAR